MKEYIEKWKRMEAEGNPAAFDYLKEITAIAQANGKTDELSEAVNYLMSSAQQRLDNVEKSIMEYTLHERLGELSEVINLAFIARRYFGKSRQWLYQRIKGYTVNGKVATFTPEERDKFMAALDEIGSRIATFTHSA